MPSWESIWIPGVVVANVLGIAIVIYSWEHAYGLLSSFKKKNKAAKLSDDAEFLDDAPEFKAREKKKKPKAKGKTTGPNQDVAIDIEDESFVPVVLSWKDIECKVYTGDATAIKTIVHSCSGSFMPSELVAIMGPSGAGKSTMLDILAGKNSGKGLTGSVTLNGEPINPHLANRCISYVGQEDVFMPMLTVWECLLFVAELSAQASSKVQRDARMNLVLNTLGLGRIKNSKVGGYLAGGTEVRGISGGEKRRLSIACGLLGNPSVVFLDEPTTGLDSHAALAVMKYLHSLTHIGHTIVTTIHQPRPEIFKSFDKLLVMSEGYQMFLAPPSFVMPWFHDVLLIPYDPKKDGTVADWLLGAIAVQFQTQSEGNKGLATAEQIKEAADRFKECVQGALLYSSDADIESDIGKMIAAAAASAPPAQGSKAQFNLINAGALFQSFELSSNPGTPRTPGHGPGSDASFRQFFSTPTPSMTNMKRIPSVESIAASDAPMTGRNPNKQASDQPELPDSSYKPDERVSSSTSPSGSGELPKMSDVGVQPSAETFVNSSLLYLGDYKTLYARGWWAQFWVLFKRSVLQQLRNPTEAGMRLIASSWCGIFFGLVWIRLPNTADSAQERLGLMFFVLMMFCMVPFSYMAFPAADKRFFKMDSAKGLYSPSAYFVSYQCGTAPFLILNTFATAIIIYGLVGLRYEAYAIIQFNFILALHALVANQLLVLCIWYFDGQDSAFSVATIYISFSLLICGFYIRVSEMTLSIMRGLSWTSFSKYTFQALAYTELQNRKWDPAPCSLQSAAPGFEQTLPLCYFRPDFLLEYYDFRIPTSKSTVALLSFYLAMCLLSYWALLKLYKRR